MSSYSYKNNITPIRQLKNPVTQTYETPAKYLYEKQKIQTLTYNDQEYYKQKCLRFEKENKQLHEEIRILSIQIKEMKTQIQIYREQSHYKAGNHGQASKNAQKQSQSAQVQKLLKEIRILKNNHEVQITNYKDLNRKLTKQVAQLQREVQNKVNNIQITNKGTINNNESQQKVLKLQKQLKQMKKSIVNYMQQRDQSNQKVQKLNSQIESLNKQLNELRSNENKLLEEKAYLSGKLFKIQSQRSRMLYGDNDQEQKLKNQENRKFEQQQTQLSSSKNRANLRQSLYQFGKGRAKTQDKIKQSQFSIHTFNGAKHVPAQQAFQISQSLNNQILRLQNQIQRRSISHTDQIHNLNYTIERYKKQLQQKQQDIVNLLIKVKPLMLQKHRLTSSSNKQNLRDEDKKKPWGVEQERQSIGNNAYGLKMLELFLKKYKIESF